jgi:hypothetical protein
MGLGRDFARFKESMSRVEENQRRVIVDFFSRVKNRKLCQVMFLQEGTFPFLSVLKSIRPHLGLIDDGEFDHGCSFLVPVLKTPIKAKRSIVVRTTAASCT